MAKEKVREVEKARIPERIRDRYQPQKDGRSTFDRVLEQNRIMQKNPQQTQIMIKEGHRHETRVARHQDQGERGKDRQSDEKEQERGKQKAKEQRKAGAETEQRVAGKGRRGDGSNKGGGKGGGKGRGFGRPLHKRSVKLLKKGALAKAAQVAAEGAKFASQLKAQMKATHLSNEFIQKIVNQIVKFVKTGINKEGDKEVRLNLHERIFRGLQLRVAQKDGKVSIHFNTSNSEVRELFANSSEDIQKELEVKGISVREIKVT